MNETQELRNKNAELRVENERLSTENATLRELVAKYEARITELENRVAELEKSRKKNSTNSSSHRRATMTPGVPNAVPKPSRKRVQRNDRTRNVRQANNAG